LLQMNACNSPSNKARPVVEQKVVAFRSRGIASLNPGTILVQVKRARPMVQYGKGHDHFEPWEKKNLFNYLCLPLHPGSDLLSW
jgi:hypothetical protein